MWHLLTVIPYTSCYSTLIHRDPYSLLEIFSSHPATYVPWREPGIYFDEVHRHPVCVTRGQQKRLLDGGSVGFDIVAATDISELAASGDFAAIPSLEVARVVEARGNR